MWRCGEQSLRSICWQYGGCEEIQWVKNLTLGVAPCTIVCRLHTCCTSLVIVWYIFGFLVNVDNQCLLIFNPRQHVCSIPHHCIQTLLSTSVNTDCSVLQHVCVWTLSLLKHGDECFEPASCPCLWKGKEYYPGDRVSSPCHQWWVNATFKMRSSALVVEI